MEWRGVWATSGTIHFSLHNRATDESVWAGIGDVFAGFEVVDYEEEGNEMTVRFGDTTRTLSLSGATVLPLEEQPEAERRSAEPPPLVRVGAGAPDPDSGPEEAADADPWERAVEQVPRLRRIGSQVSRIESEEARIREGLAQDNELAESEREAISNRQDELRERRRRLTELALTEVRDSTSLSGEERQSLMRQLGGDASEGPELPEIPGAGEGAPVPPDANDRRSREAD